MVWIVTTSVEEAKEEKNASDVPVVKEYLGVFPEDLSGLPLIEKLSLLSI